MINIETYCGICGTRCCYHTDVEYSSRSVKLTIACPKCINKIDTMVQKIDELSSDLEECLKECENGNN